MVIFVRKDLFYKDVEDQTSGNIQMLVLPTMVEKKRKEMKDITNVPAKMMKHENRNVEVKSQNVESENIANTNFSNNKKDACKTLCRICQKPLFLNTLRSHTRIIHKIKINEYNFKVFHCYFCLVHSGFYDEIIPYEAPFGSRYN